MKIAIIGTGYVGLTTGVCLADLGHHVVCIDHNPDKVARLKQWISPIFEPGIEDLIKKNLNKNLAFEVEIAPAVKNSEVIFICVNTPPKPNGQADLKYIEKAAREIAQFMNSDYKGIVDKSTVPVRTAVKVKETIMAYATE